MLNLASATPDHLTGIVITLVATLAFLVVAIQKEIFGTPVSSRWSLAARGLNISLIPLGVVFFWIFAQRLIEINSH